MNIFVARYGQTEWNVMKKMQGSADIELNEKAENVQDFFKRIYDFLDDITSK